MTVLYKSGPFLLLETSQATEICDRAENLASFEGFIDEPRVHLFQRLCVVTPPRTPWLIVILYKVDPFRQEV